MLKLEEVEGVVEEEVVVVVLGGKTGSPAVAFSKRHVEQHLVPGVQVHDGGGGVAGQAAGSGFQLLGVPRELQGEGLQGDQAEFSARRSPCHPQSQGRGWHLRLLPRPG